MVRYCTMDSLRSFSRRGVRITSENIDEFKEHKNPTIQRFMGELNGKEDAYLGSKLELYREWCGSNPLHR